MVLLADNFSLLVLSGWLLLERLVLLAALFSGIVVVLLLVLIIAFLFIFFVVVAAWQVPVASDPSFELKVVIFAKVEQQVFPVVLQVTLRRSGHVQDKRFHLSISLEIGVGLLEVVNEAVFSLDSSIGYFADLFRIEALPSLTVQLFKELEDKN